MKDGTFHKSSLQRGDLDLQFSCDDGDLNCFLMSCFTNKTVVILRVLHLSKNRGTTSQPSCYRRYTMDEMWDCFGSGT